MRMRVRTVKSKIIMQLFAVLILFSFIIPAGAVRVLGQGVPDFATKPNRRIARHSKIRSAQAAGGYLFGVLNDDGAHYQDEWERGVRATNFEVQWKRYEPAQGVYDQAYIEHLRSVLRGLKQQGWVVQLVPGYHYAPGWVFSSYPNMNYVNQFGDVYDPDPVAQGDFRVINAPFNPQARALVAGYLEHLLTVGFPQSDPQLRFDSVRVGGGVQGELRYPPAAYNGHNNSYWAFDVFAQDPARVAAIPDEIVGWRPGIDPNPGTVGAGQLLVNPGFEQDELWYPLLGWTPDDEVAAESTGQAAHGGTRSLKVVLNSANRVHQFVRVQAGATYNFGGWVRSGDGQGRARIFVTQYDAGNRLIDDAGYVKLESRSAEWASVNGSVQAAADTRFFKLEVDGDQNGIYYFDDLWLVEQGSSSTSNRQIDIPLKFYDWYVSALTGYQNWQIGEIRRHFSGGLDIVYAGKGVLVEPIMGALTNDLSGDGWSEASRGLYAGTAYDRHVSGLPQDAAIALYLTGIEDDPVEIVDDVSPYPGRWSAARWLASLAAGRGFAVWAENSGQDDAAALWLAAQRMQHNGFFGLMWGFENELYSGSSEFASIETYQQVIRFYQSANKVFMPLVGVR